MIEKTHQNPKISVMKNRYGKFSVRFYDDQGNFENKFFNTNADLYEFIREVFGDINANGFPRSTVQPSSDS